MAIEDIEYLTKIDPSKPSRDGNEAVVLAGRTVNIGSKVDGPDLNAPSGHRANPDTSWPTVGS